MPSNIHKCYETDSEDEDFCIFNALTTEKPMTGSKLLSSNNSSDNDNIKLASLRKKVTKPRKKRKASKKSTKQAPASKKAVVLQKKTAAPKKKKAKSPTSVHVEDPVNVVTLLEANQHIYIV